MDSTTVFLMRQAANAVKMKSDSLLHFRDSLKQVAAEASRASAEWVLLRHDIVLLLMVIIPSVVIYLTFKQNQRN